MVVLQLHAWRTHYWMDGITDEVPCIDLCCLQHVVYGIQGMSGVQTPHMMQQQVDRTMYQADPGVHTHRPLRFHCRRPSRTLNMGEAAHATRDSYPPAVVELALLLEPPAAWKDDEALLMPLSWRERRLGVSPSRCREAAPGAERRRGDCFLKIGLVCCAVMLDLLLVSDALEGSRAECECGSETGVKLKSDGPVDMSQVELSAVYQLRHTLCSC